MAAAAAAPPVPDYEGAGERLAAALQALGDALRQEAGLTPGLWELVGSWEARSQALVGALTGGAGLLRDDGAPEAAQLLQPLLCEAFVAAHPGLFAKTLEVARSLADCCSETRAHLSCYGPVGASLLGLFLSEQCSPGARGRAAAPLARALALSGHPAVVLAAAGGEGAVDALIAAATREGDPRQDMAFMLLAQLSADDLGARERIAGAFEALLPIAVARLSAAAAGVAGRDAFAALQGPLLLLGGLVSGREHALEHARALATSGLAAAAVDLLLALGSEKWAAVREDWPAAGLDWAASWDKVEGAALMLLAVMMETGGAAVAAAAIDALTSRGGLPRVLELLRSPHWAPCHAAGCCLVSLADSDAGRDALFQAPRAASQLTAALRRAHAEGEDPLRAQLHVGIALSALLNHSQGARVADGLARAAAAEGSAGSLLAALTGLLTASVGVRGTVDKRYNMFGPATLMLSDMVASARAKQLRLVPVLQAAPVAGACVRALRHWLAEATDDDMNALLVMANLVATLAGFDAEQEGAAAADIPSANAGTAAARAALREAPGVEAGLRRLLAWARRRPHVQIIEAVKWLIRLPEVKAPAAAAASQAACPAPAVRTAAPAPAAPAARPPPAAPSPSAMQQPRNDSSAGSGSSGSSSGGDGTGCSPAAAAQTRACGACGKSGSEVPLLRCAGCKAQHYCGDACAKAHWPSHRDACKAARRAAAATRP